jgi:hypothetical protein
MAYVCPKTLENPTYAAGDSTGVNTVWRSGNYLVRLCLWLAKKSRWIKRLLLQPQVYVSGRFLTCFQLVDFFFDLGDFFLYRFDFFSR